MPTSDGSPARTPSIQRATLSAPCSGRRAARILPPPSVHAVTSGAGKLHHLVEVTAEAAGQELVGHPAASIGRGRDSAADAPERENAHVRHAQITRELCAKAGPGSRMSP